MKRIWLQLERWMADHVGDEFTLRGPASEADITAAEHVVGAAFPPDLRDSFKVHDGQVGDSVAWLPGGPLLSLAGLLRVWRSNMHHVDEAYQRDFYDEIAEDGRTRELPFHAARIPVAYDEIGTCGLYVDLIPGPRGVRGQVIHDHTECDFAVLGAGFRPFLTRYVELLEAGELVWWPDNKNEWSVSGFVVPRGGGPTDDILPLFG